MESRTPSAERLLPRNRAFVVQLSAQSAGTPDSFRGRVEHVESGQATHFDALEDLLAFVARVLSDWRTPVA